MDFQHFINQHINYHRTKTGKEVDILFGNLFAKATELDAQNGAPIPIHGVLAYAGVSRNNRLYLPEELAKGHEKIVPLQVNHSSVLGMEAELATLPIEIQQALQRGEDVRVGEVRLTWHPNELTLTYEGFVSNEFFKREVNRGRVSVSLGVAYEADAPEVCDVECYTMIKGARFEEVSLVYHPGFPVASVKTVENYLKSHAGSRTDSKLNTFKPLLSRENNTMRKSKHSKELDEGIGGIDNPADEPLSEAGGPNCPDGQVVNNETGNCETIDTTQDSPSNLDDTGAPKKVVADGPAESSSENRKRGKRGREMDMEDDHDRDDDEDDSFENRSGHANADLRSERKRTLEHLKAIERKEALQQVNKQAKLNKAKETYLKSIELDNKIKQAKEFASNRGKFVISQEKHLTKANEVAVLRPAQWFKAVKEHRNPPSAWEWVISKEGIFQNEESRHIKHVDEHYRDVLTPMSNDMKKGTEAITGPPAADFMRIMSEQVLVLPEGKIVTPIRQFCEVKVLPPGTKEAFFYDYGAINFSDITEGTLIADSTTVTRSAGGETNPRGARVQINYSDIEESPIDLVAANNRSFALESVNDESVEILDRTYNDDAGSSGDATNRKAKGGGTKDGKWVNGNDGTALTTGSPDSGLTAADTLTFEGLLDATVIIEDEGLDISNLVMYTTPKAIKDLIKDPELDSYIGFSRPDIITEGVVERIAGVNLVKTSALAPLAGGGVATGRRSVLFIPQVAFGLVTGRDLTMEAQRRNELQTIHLTGTQKIAGFVKNVEGTCRVSHA